MANNKMAILNRVVQYSKLAVLNTFSRHSLIRQPEPQAVCTELKDVNDYSQVMSTVMILPYLLGMDLIHRIRPEGANGHALDVCCGPGHISILLAKELGYKKITGADLSSEMLKIAQRNAQSQGVDKIVQFQKEDVTLLQGCPSGHFDLVTFFNGAHHLDSIDEVKEAFKQIERVTNESGLIVVMDPIRQKTKRLAEGYVKAAGQDYLDRGLVNFYRQFRDSIYASFTPSEFLQAVPKNSPRKWVQIIPTGLPTFQILVGLPVGQSNMFLRSSLPSEFFNRLIPDHARSDWNFFRTTFRIGSHRHL